jgi:DNA polymerase-3 subunit alpha
LAAEFVHLHLHSDYSLLDGLGKIKNYVAMAKGYGMPALALSDHGVLYGAYEMYTAARKAGIKPIIGCEVYVAPRSLHDKQGKLDSEYYHLLVLARDYQGYQNLMKLVSLAHMEGYYYKPRIDHDALAKHSEGLIVTSACLGGEICQLLLRGQDREARERADLYRSIVGRENYFLEVQDHPIEEQQVANGQLIELARELDIPLVATCDVHYPRKEDAEIQDVLLCVQTGRLVRDENRMRMSAESFYLRPAEEMARSFGELPEALSNTLAIAEMCDLEIPTGKWILPHYEVPAGHTAATYLRELCEQGLSRRYETVTPKVRERLEYELDIIEKKGYPTYMLIVQDYVNWARQQGIAVTSRGSAAGSLVSYLTNITSADPLEYDLPFERFLTVHRPSPPDIDIDFEDSRREEVIQYVTRKYGQDKVAQIITFGTMESRAAVRDVARVLEVSYGDADALAKLIPATIPPTPIKTALDTVPPLKSWYDRDPEIRRLLDVASRLEGVTRHASTHAAGVIIARDPIVNYAPVQKEANGNKPIIQYDMNAAEGIGLLKADFLGLANLSILGRAVKTIKQTTGRDIDLDELPLDDKNTYELLSSGETTGVFQLESAGMRRYIRDLKPSDIRDIAAMISLYRPGPMEFIPNYIRRKHGEEPVTYLVPQLEGILKASYGVLVYQDDILQLSIEVAGYTWEEADKLRKAVGKKIKAELDAQREKFIQGCQAHGGLSPQKALELWEWMEPFARYGFGKCLSGRTYVWLGDGTRMQLSRAAALGVTELMAMWPDGEIRPHRVKRIVPTGKKQTYKLTTASGRTLRLTREHRLLTTAGYKPLSEFVPGETELLVAPRRTTERQRAARRGTMTALNRTPEQRRRVSERVVAWQAGRTPDEVAANLIAWREANPEEAALARERACAALRAVPVEVRKDSARRAWRERPGAFARSLAALAEYRERVGNAQVAAPLRAWEREHPEEVERQRQASSERAKRQHQDPAFAARLLEGARRAVTERYSTGPGFGVCSIAPNGMLCLSRAEREMCEWLVELGISFEKEKLLPSGRRCDFYFAGIYWEMDGLDRAPEFFREKYGDLPHVVVTPEDYKLKIGAHLGLEHAENGDRVVSIEPWGWENTWDVEMEDGGPKNFIANKLVSHNSHAAAYSLVAYQTAYLKANYPSEYMSAFLTVAMGNAEKIVAGITECKRMGIEVLPPDINRSQEGFSLEPGEHDRERPVPIRFGLSAIKNVGSGPIHALIEAREKLPEKEFKSLDHLCQHVDGRLVNKRVLESLIKAGAADALGTRAQLLHVLDDAMTIGQRAQKASGAGQMSLFGGATTQAEETYVPSIILPAVPDTPREQQLSWEKEMLGIYITEHPLTAALTGDRSEKVSLLADLGKELVGQSVQAIGMLTSTRVLTTKKKQSMLVGKLEDLTGSLDLVAFPETYEQHRELLRDDAILQVSGKLDERNESLQLILDSASPYSAEPEEGAGDPGSTQPEERDEQDQDSPSDAHRRHELRILLPAGDDLDEDVGRMHDLYRLLKRYPGPDRVTLQLSVGRRSIVIEPHSLDVLYSAALETELEALLGGRHWRVLDATRGAGAGKVA